MDFVRRQRPDYGTMFPPRWLCIPLMGVCVLLPVYVDLYCPATSHKLLREVQASNPYGTGQMFFIYYDLRFVMVYVVTLALWTLGTPGPNGLTSKKKHNNQEIFVLKLGDV